VGKVDKMRPSESLRNLVGSSDQKWVLIEEGHRSVIIIGGIRIFLQIIPVEANAKISGSLEEKAYPVVNFVEEEEKEKTLMSSLAEKEDHTVNMISHWE